MSRAAHHTFGGIMNSIEGQLQAQGLTFTIVATRFNDFIVDRLVAGAVDYLQRHGCDPAHIRLVRIPGAFEMPVVCQKIAARKDCHGIIAVGAVIRGATPHFDYVCGETVRGLGHVALQYGIPVGLGLLTTDNLEQAMERAGSKAGNKGQEAAAAVLETVRVLELV